METVKYIIKRLLLAVVILLGVSVIIYALARMMPNDYIDNTYSSALAQGTMTQEDVDRIKELYGLNMPDAYLSFDYDGEKVKGTFSRNVKDADYQNVQLYSGTEKVVKMTAWYTGGSYSFDKGGQTYQLSLRTTGTLNTYRLQLIKGEQWVETEVQDMDKEGNLLYNEDGTPIMSIVNQLVVVSEEIEGGMFTVSEDGNLVLEPNNSIAKDNVSYSYRLATGWDKTKALIGGYFNWLGNLLKGDLGMSFKYKKPVGEVIFQNMGISFGIAFVATILQFLIAIPLGIKAAVNQYGVVDYTVTVLTMIGISLPSFFFGAIIIRVFAMGLGWFPVSGLHGSLAVGSSWWTVTGDTLWHLILPMLVLVVLSIGSLMRYTRTNTLEVLNADYIRTARAKGLSEKSVIYKHAFRNTLIPIVTLLAGILPGLFGGAMITEQVFAIPGIGYMAYQALLVGDIPFIMGYNMFIAILTVLGTLLSDLMYAVVDPRVKIGR